MHIPKGSERTPMNSYLELQYPLLGETLPTQYAYPLYGALSRLLPELHAADCPVRVGPVRGTPAGRGVLHLPAGRSLLRLRTPEDQLRTLLCLAGKPLDVAGHRLRLGVPRVQMLVPAPMLFARLVVVKANQRKEEKRPPLRPPTPEQFLQIVRAKLDQLEVKAEPSLPLTPTGPHAGQPRRGVLRIQGRTVVGYSVLLAGLTAEESVQVQERGIGGRLRMGCGFFVPLKDGVQ
jgi:CRISPR-associated protein Cas6